METFPVGNVQEVVVPRMEDQGAALKGRELTLLAEQPVNLSSQLFMGTPQLPRLHPDEDPVQRVGDGALQDEPGGCRVEGGGVDRIEGAQGAAEKDQPVRIDSGCLDNGRD